MNIAKLLPNLAPRRAAYATLGILLTGGIAGSLAVAPMAATVSAAPLVSTSAQQQLHGAVTIKNSGSTNTSGWEITINADGGGSLTYGNGMAPTIFPVHSFDSSRLAKLIKKVGPLNKLQPTGHIMKSISFGTTETVSYNGHTSGDLEGSFAGASHAQQQLVKAIRAVVAKANPTNPIRVHLPML